MAGDRIFTFYCTIFELHSQKASVENLKSVEKWLSCDELKLYKVHFEKTAFKVPALAAASHKFPAYPMKNSHFLTEIGPNTPQAQHIWHFRLVNGKKHENGQVSLDDG